MMKIMIAILSLVIATTTYAADDPTIKDQLRLDIQSAMKIHITENQIKGSYVYFDTKTGKLLKLQLEELHSGIVSKGDFYVSCADFRSSQGDLYDIDFLVSGEREHLRVYQAIIHKSPEGKRKYHIEKIK